MTLLQPQSLGSRARDRRKQHHQPGEVTSHTGAVLFSPFLWHATVDRPFPWKPLSAVKRKWVGHVEQRQGDWERSHHVSCVLESC